jgi:hypothetical protein
MADKKTHVGLRLQKLAGPQKYDVNTGEPLEREFAGIKVLDHPLHNDDIPTHVKVPVTTIDRGVAEGWITTEGDEPHHYPGGNKENPWGTVHTTVHRDSFTIHDADGDITYKVTHQPGKYNGAGDLDESSDVAGELDARVDWFYLAELEA